MTVEIHSQAPEARCYICGKTEIAVVCHHCGRGMCSDHGPQPLPQKKGIELLEFSDLEIRELRHGQAAAHCRDCVHYTRRPFWWIPNRGGVLGILGGVGCIIYAISAETAILLPIGVLGLVIGITIILLHQVVEPRSLRKQMLEQRSPFPLISSLSSDITESLGSTISLSDTGEYTVASSAPMGKLIYALTMTQRNREQLQFYVQKYSTSLQSVKVDGGVVIIQGRARIRHENLDDSVSSISAQTFILRSDTAQFPFLADPNHRNRTWHTERLYTVHAEQSEVSSSNVLPFTVVPILVMTGMHRAFTLDINLLDSKQDFPELGTVLKVTELVIKAPLSLGQVRTVNPTARTSIIPAQDENTEGYQQITWHELPIRPDERRDRRKSIYLSFENSIEPETVIIGHMSVLFEGTLSGARGVKYFNALGFQGTIQEQTAKSLISVDFELSLESLQFQEEVSLQHTVIQDNVILNYQLIIELTDHLSKQGFYFKQTIENPESPSTRRAFAVNRYWDIEGRYYQGVYPIDVHLILKGEAALRPQEDGFVGEAQVEISVKGTVTNQDMRNKVESVFQQLKHNTEHILEQVSKAQADLIENKSTGLLLGPSPSSVIEHPPPPASMPISTPPGSYSGMVDNSFAEFITQAVQTAIDRSLRGILLVSLPPQQSDQIANEAKVNEQRELEILKQRREKLMDALLNGFISEDFYRHMITQIDRELETFSAATEEED